MMDIARSLRQFDPGAPCAECGKPTYCTRSGARCVEHWVTPEVEVPTAVALGVPNGTPKEVTPVVTAAPSSKAERDTVRAANYRTNPRSAVFQRQVKP